MRARLWRSGDKIFQSYHGETHMQRCTYTLCRCAAPSPSPPGREEGAPRAPRRRVAQSSRDGTQLVRQRVAPSSSAPGASGCLRSVLDAVRPGPRAVSTRRSLRCGRAARRSLPNASRRPLGLGEQRPRLGRLGGKLGCVHDACNGYGPLLRTPLP
jgi:hypothetical protein